MVILEVSGVNKSFGGLKALTDVNLSIEESSVHAIIGPNGAGKSTLLNCLIGKLEPDSGVVTENPGVKLVARVFQTPEVFGDMTLLENVMIPSFAKRDGNFRFNGWGAVAKRGEVNDEALAMLEEVGLVEQRNVITDALSRGDKRRLELAMCLIQHPKLLLLDEPTAGMSRADTNNTIELLKKIGERGITKIIIEHDMHVVFSLADRISVLAQGTVIVEGEPESIKGDPRVIEAYLGGELG